VKWIDKTREILENMRNRIPFLKMEEESGIDEIEGKPDIPELYLQQFLFLNPMTFFEETLKGREQEGKLLKQAYDNWAISHRPLLITGEAGAGMSTLLTFAQAKLFPDAHVISEDLNINTHNELLQLLQGCFQAPDARNLTDLAEFIKTKEEPIVVVFENVERLYLRRIHGFDLLRDFLLFIQSTRNHVFWLVTINEYSYYYLNRSIDFGDYFLSSIKLKPIANEDVISILSDGNQGYDIIYLKPKNVGRMLNRKLIKNSGTDKQELLRANYIYQLDKFSQGNISRAILYWINSIVRFKENKIYVKPYEAGPALNEVSLDDLFILEAILQHTSLSSKELQLVLRQSNKHSQLILEQFVDKQIIQPTYYEGAEKPEYKINLLYMKELKDLFHQRLNRNIS